LDFLVHNFNNATFDSFWSFPEANARLNEQSFAGGYFAAQRKMGDSGTLSVAGAC
jgi:hypothetical protein